MTLTIGGRQLPAHRAMALADLEAQVKAGHIGPFYGATCRAALWRACVPDPGLFCPTMGHSTPETELMALTTGRLADAMRTCVLPALVQLDPHAHLADLEVCPGRINLDIETLAAPVTVARFLLPWIPPVPRDAARPARLICDGHEIALPPQEVLVHADDSVTWPAVVDSQSGWPALADPGAAAAPVAFHGPGLFISVRLAFPAAVRDAFTSTAGLSPCRSLGRLCDVGRPRHVHASTRELATISGHTTRLARDIARAWAPFDAATTRLETQAAADHAALHAAFPASAPAPCPAQREA